MQGETLSMRFRYFQLINSVIALLAITVHLVWPTLAVDNVTLGFLIFATVPWLLPWIKSLKIGDVEITLNDIPRAILAAGTATNAPSDSEEVKFSPLQNHITYLDLFNHDSNLAMAALRIEIEKRVRKLGVCYGIQNYMIPLSRVLSMLRDKRVLEPSIENGLLDLISVGNRAAHGVTIDQGVAQWAHDNADTFLYFLDRKIASRGGAND